MQFSDRSIVAGTAKRDSDGALLCDVRIARTGIQTYLGREADPGNDAGMRDKALVRVYRPGEEVFSQDTLASAAHRPVTNEHPRDPLVNADNWKKYAVGNTADEVKGEGIYIRVPLMVSDGATIRDIENGKRELSAGYTSTLDWTPGETPDGEKYDAVQRDIRINHIAVVHRGRAGSAVRIGDSFWGPEPVQDSGEPQGEYTMTSTLKTVTVDGLSIEVTDQGAQVISKLQTQIQSMTDSATRVLTEHATALATRDSDLAKKDAEIEALKKQILSDADLDARVTARATLVDNARKVAKDLKVEGLTDAQIRRAAVVAVYGDAAVKDKTDVYVDTRFDILVEDSGKTQTATQDSFRQAISGAQPVNDADPRGSAYTKMVADMKSGGVAAN